MLCRITNNETLLYINIYSIITCEFKGRGSKGQKAYLEVIEKSEKQPNNLRLALTSSTALFVKATDKSQCWLVVIATCDNSERLNLKNSNDSIFKERFSSFMCSKVKREYSSITLDRRIEKLELKKWAIGVNSHCGCSFTSNQILVN